MQKRLVQKLEISINNMPNLILRLKQIARRKKMKKIILKNKT